MGTLLNSPPIMLFYLGRLANALAWCLIVYLALRLTPTAPWLLAALALAPMSIYQAASLSYDAPINSLSFLVLALILRRAVASEYGLNWKDLFIWMLLIVAIIASKPFYAALMFLVFIVPPASFGHRAHYLKTALFLVVATSIFFGLWIVVQQNFLTYDEYNPAFRDGQALMPGVHLPMQIHYVASHPGAFLGAGARALFSVESLTTWIGKLGWLDTFFPRWFYLGFGVLVLLLVATDRVAGVRIALWQRVLLAGIAAAVIGLLLLSLYLTWTPVGAPYIRGVQGRYLIPVVPLILIACHGNFVRLPPAWRDRCIMICLILVQGMTLAVVLRRYYF